MAVYWVHIQSPAMLTTLQMMPIFTLSGCMWFNILINNVLNLCSYVPGSKLPTLLNQCNYFELSPSLNNIKVKKSPSGNAILLDPCIFGNRFKLRLTENLLSCKQLGIKI